MTEKSVFQPWFIKGWGFNRDECYYFQFIVQIMLKIGWAVNFI